MSQPSVRFSDIIPSFNGTQDFAQWISKLELVADLQGVKDKQKFLPLFLSEGAFSVFQGLEKEVQDDYGRLKSALMQAFCMDSGSAYEHFRNRSLMAGKTVYVYLADITRLGHLVDSELSENFLKHAFVAGLPSAVKDKIKTSDHYPSCRLEKQLPVQVFLFLICQLMQPLLI